MDSTTTAPKQPLLERRAETPSHLTRLPLARRHAAKAAAIAVVGIGLTLTMLVTQKELKAADDADHHRYERLTEKLKAELTRRVIVYEYGLQGSRGLFPASKSVERDEFRAMVDAQALETDFPGALGIGYIHRIEDDSESIDTFLANTRLQGAPEFTITIPPGASPLPGSVIDERMIIEFIEPVEENRPALGLDIGSHPVRREAAERAVLTGEGSITGRIDLVQDDEKFAGFLYLLPVYTNGMPTETPEQRLLAARGWVYMPMIAPPVFDGATLATDHEITFAAFDGEATTAEAMIYQSSEVHSEDGQLAEGLAASNASQFQSTDVIQIGGRPWTVSMQTTDLFSAAPRSTAWAFCIGGVLFSVLLGLLVYLLGSAARRAHAVAEGMTSDLRRYAEEAGSATRAKSEFIANMSHEIRTPMTAILGYADLLRDDEQAQVSQSKRLEYLGTIKRNGTHLLGILNDILDISKIEAGKLSVESIDTSTETLIHEVVSLMSVKANSKGLDIGIHLATPVPSMIRSDPVRFRQILVNLVGNAVKFTQQGGITLELGWDNQDACLTCAVIDTGIGLTPEQIGRLFQAFEQADTTTTREYGGSGLGLQISRRLAEIMGGSITVESEQGVGSRFTLRLPVGLADDVVMLPVGPSRVLRMNTDESPETMAAEPLRGLRVILAEDGIDNQQLIGFHLRKAGAMVTILENGKLAVEALTRDGTMESPIDPHAPCDLLLTDMQMPVMDGYTAVRLLRDKGCRLPIVALTAHAMSGDRDRCLEAGCDDYAAKPIDRDRLIGVCLETVRRNPVRITAA